LKYQRKEGILRVAAQAAPSAGTVLLQAMSMSSSVPKVSIIMPAYNRADTIRRAIKSAQAQTWRDWELVVVDDGSTDGTGSLVPRNNPQIVLITQENRGFVEARNTGLRAARGDYIAFLDSDDEWLPHHLELCIGFLEAFPDERFVATELLEDFGGGRRVNHYQVETSDWYPRMAAQIGTHSVDLPPGETDNYMRVYESRTPVGEWGAAALERMGVQQRPFVYSGRIFEHLRWGFLIAVNSLVLRRSTLNEVGLLDGRYQLAADQHLIAKLCLQYRANFIGTPTYIKHEFAEAGALPAESHLATGRTALRFLEDMLRTFDDLFWIPHPEDAELRAIRSLMLLDIAQVALRSGKRDRALEALRNARRGLPGFGRAITLHWAAVCMPSPQAAVKLWTTCYRGLSAMGQFGRGEISAKVLLRKARVRLGWA
jgi:glycosyltransferase involved in cell wall biosynthesis